MGGNVEVEPRVSEGWKWEIVPLARASRRKRNAED